MKPKVLQVCFVLDCTASMQPWIDAAKEKIVDTLESIHQTYPEYQIWAAFVGYRDFHDKEQFIRIPFTKNIQDLQDQIMDIEADGGDDICEDVAGAYRFANGLEWHADVRCLFHITDAPNHGLEYHEEHVEDDYPDGHPYIHLRDEVREMAHRSIDLTVFRIKATTDIMYQIMRQIYQGICPDKFAVVNLRDRRNYRHSDVFYSEISQRILSSMSSDPS
jgi:Mg-chelatase subunit ChlD